MGPVTETATCAEGHPTTSSQHLAAGPPIWQSGNAGDLKHIPAASIDLIVTSPSYWRRRDYGHPDQLGQEASPDEYIDALIRIMDAWKRVLKPSSSVFVNIGDSYLDGFLVGIPALFEVAVRKAGWNIANHIVWTKTIGIPEPQPYRLVSRHEAIYHLTLAKRSSEYYFDIKALSADLGRSANPGDTWHSTRGEDPVATTPDSDDVDNVWPLFPTRSRSAHIAPFPPDLARRAILLACPERVCTMCGQPHRRLFEPTAELDPTRPQAVRALALFKEAGLTDEHLTAIRAVGISDAGKGKQIQHGSGRNAERIAVLAAEAKEALGGYFREFTFAPKRHVGWDTCDCGAPTEPGKTLDTFMGSGTTLRVAQELGRNAVGVDLTPPDTIDDVRIKK